LLTKIWKLNIPKLALFFQCGSNYKRFIDSESPFYQTHNLWVLTNGKLSGKSRDTVTATCSGNKTTQIGIVSSAELHQVTSVVSHSIDFYSSVYLDSDCNFFIFVDSGACPDNQAMQIFQNAMAHYLQKGINIISKAIKVHLRWHSPLKNVEIKA